MLLLPPNGPGKQPLSRSPLLEASSGRRWFPVAEQRLPALALFPPVRYPRPDPDVIRAVEQLTLVVLDHDGDLLLPVDTPQFVLLVGAGPEIALAVEA